MNIGDKVLLIEDYNEHKVGELFIYAGSILDSGYDCKLLIVENEDFNTLLKNCGFTSFSDYYEDLCNKQSYEQMLMTLSINFNILKPLSKIVTTQDALESNLKELELQISKVKCLLRKIEINVKKCLTK